MTTILCIRKGNEVVMAGDGQATLGEAVIFKSKSVKVRRIGNGKIIAGDQIIWKDHDNMIQPQWKGFTHF